MRIVCEATQSTELKIRRAAFECLVAISATYYEKLVSYMQDIFNITEKLLEKMSSLSLFKLLSFRAQSGMKRLTS